MRHPLVAWLALGIIWGATWLFIKLGLEDLPPFTFAGIRFLIAVLPLAVMVRVRRLPLPSARADWRLLIVTGLLTFTACYGLVFWGEARISSGLTAILFVTYPLFGLVFAHLAIADDRMSAPRVIGVLLGIAGVALIFGKQVGIAEADAFWGSLAIVASAAVAAASTVMIKARGSHLDPLVVTAVQMAVGAPPLLALGLLLETNPLRLQWTPIALVSLAYLAFVGSTLAFVMWYRLVQDIRVSTAQLLPLVNTLVAVVLGWLVLDEELGLRALLGGTLVLIGLGLALRWRGRRSAAPATEPG